MNATYLFHPQEWSISNFPYLFARNITSHSMKNLAFDSLLRREMIILPIFATSLIRCSLKCWDEVLFDVGVKGLNFFPSQQDVDWKPWKGWLSMKRNTFLMIRTKVNSSKFLPFRAPKARCVQYHSSEQGILYSSKKKLDAPTFIPYLSRSLSVFHN